MINTSNQINVLMIGPDRTVHGGISAMVNNLYDAGLGNEVNLKYIGTMKEGSKIKKLLVALCAYIHFLTVLSKFDVVHVNVASDSSFYRKSLFIKAAHRHHKKIVIHQHGGNFDGYYQNSMNSTQKENAKKILGHADEMIVLTPSYEDFFRNELGINNISVIPNSIKVPDFDSDTISDFEVDNKHNQISSVKSCPHNLLFLGRICATKGMTELLDAIDILKKDYPDIILYIGGIFEDTSYQKRIEEMNANVQYLGWINGETKNEYLRKCGLFVLPTYFEGQPVSVLEAMAYNCCVVASEVGGIPMMITDKVDGILTKPKDVNSLVNGIKAVLDSPELRKTLTENAYRRVKEGYSIDKTIKSLVELYGRV